MQLAVEAAGVGLWEWDVKRDRVHIIHSDETRFPREPRELPNLEAYLATMHAEDREAVRAAIRRALETGDDCRLEFRVLTRNPASPRWLGSRGRVEYGPDGQPVLMRGVVYDVTHRRLAQERVQVVLDATPNGFIMTNASGDVVMANAQTERILGYAKGELLGRKLETLVPDGLREAHASRRRECVSSPGPRAMALGRKVVGRRKDGSEVAVEIGLTPVDMPDGRFVLAAIVDITERERLKREAAQRMDELAHLSRVAVLGELSGSIAHELKQPLAAMLVNAQSAQRFLRASPASLGEVPPALADIVSEGQRAIELIDRLRDLFRKAESDRKPLDVNAVVVETLAILRSELNYRALTPTLRLASNLPPVAADRIQIQQVLLNLIMNAADAMRDLDAQNRHLTIQTARVDAGPLQVWISDSGHGISEDDLPRIFEPFMTSKQDGLGLGLAVCRTIVEAHGGAISAENNVDRGATFRVTLPCTSDKLR